MTVSIRCLHALPADRHGTLMPVDRSVLPILLAGGRGSRLHELTDGCCKPAVPFVAGRRIIDFTMANLVDSGLTDILVATQYRADTVEEHLRRNWRSRLAPGGLRLRDPARRRRGRTRFDGTADAVRGNIDEIDAADPDEVLILAADHVYKMDYRPMIAAHRRSNAALTVAVDMVPRAEASAYGVLDANTAGRVTRFIEKPPHPPGAAADPARALVSMGVYVIDWAWLRDLLIACPAALDFGHDVLPRAVSLGLAQVFAPGAAGRFYWRDVGTLDSLRRAALDFHAPRPPFALPRITLTAAAKGARPAPAVNIRRSFVMDDALVSPGARLSDAIVAPGCVLPFGTVIGADHKADARWYRRTAAGTVLVTPEMVAEAGPARARRAAAHPARPLREHGKSRREPIPRSAV